MPKRIQLKRTKGWRKPQGAVVVSRPSKWGNPFSLASKVEAVMKFRDWLRYMPNDPELIERRQWILDNLEQLRGKDLCCWCSTGSACHADVLLELANKTA